MTDSFLKGIHCFCFWRLKNKTNKKIFFFFVTGTGFLCTMLLAKDE